MFIELYDFVRLIFIRSVVLVIALDSAEFHLDGVTFSKSFTLVYFLHQSIVLYNHGNLKAIIHELPSCSWLKVQANNDEGGIFVYDFFVGDIVFRVKSIIDIILEVLAFKLHSYMSHFMGCTNVVGKNLS